MAILRKLGPLSKPLMKVLLYKKLDNMENEKQVVQNYLEQINLLPGSSELALIYILNPGGVAIKPL